MSILRDADFTHDIRSAFSRGAIKGYIYVECRMTGLVKSLLGKTTGVRVTEHGIQMKEIDPSDYVKLLTMRSVDTCMRKGDWVRVKKGLYKGDEAVVSGVEQWGVKLLLVPRVDGKHNTSIKRKSITVRPNAQLLDHNHEFANGNSMIRDDESGAQSIGEMTIEHGLIVKDFDYPSVLPNIYDMSHQLFSEFIRSRHPLVNNESHILRPREWCMAIDDRVVDTADNEEGTVTEVLQGFAEVLMDAGMTRQIKWIHLQKSFKIGEEVTIMNGCHSGSTGWVVSVRDKVAFVVKKHVEDVSTPSTKEQRTEVSLLNTNQMLNVRADINTILALRNCSELSDVGGVDNSTVK